MRDYGKVYSTFWSSATTGGMSDDAKLLALYLMTCSHSTIVGVFRLPDGYISEDLGWVPERVAEGFAELFRKGFANRCGTSKWVWIRKHLDWNKPENPNQRKAAAKVALSIPDECAWKLDFMRVCGPLLGLQEPEDLERFGNGCETLSKPETETGTETGTEEPPSGDVAAKSPRPTRKAPPGFLVDADLQAWARKTVPGLNIRAETEKFRDHTYKPALTAWPGAWRNWMRRAADMPAARPGARSVTDDIFAGAK